MPPVGVDHRNHPNLCVVFRAARAIEPTVVIARIVMRLGRIDRLSLVDREKLIQLCRIEEIAAAIRAMVQLDIVKSYRNQLA